MARGRVYSLAYFQTFSVCTCTPATASTTMTAAPAVAREAHVADLGDVRRHACLPLAAMRKGNLDCRRKGRCGQACYHSLGGLARGWWGRSAAMPTTI